MPSPPSRSHGSSDRWRRPAAIAVAAIGILLVLLLVADAFAWPLLRRPLERKLTASIGSEVRIATLARVGAPSLAPLLELRGIRIAQPAWAGRGDMAQVRTVRIRLPLLPALIGRVRPEAIAIDGARLALIRAADGRANWRHGGDTSSGGPSPRFGNVVVTDTTVALDDAQRDRRFRLRAAVDGAGLRIAGTGTIAGTPATVAFAGDPVGGQADWGFHGAIRSPVVSLRIAGRAVRPLDLGRFTARVETEGRDLQDLDRLIEAGLPPTQPFRLAGTVRRVQPTWAITDLSGTLGRSDVAGRLAVHKTNGRTVLDGDLSSRGFDFDDLDNAAGRAKAAAKARVTGPRFFPETPIDLTKLRNTDGTVRVRLARILSAKPTAVRSLDAALTLDHGVLTVSPLTVGLIHGVVRGSAVVRHQSGAPLLVTDLTLTGSRLEGVFVLPKDGTGAMDGRVRLSGHGRTVRAAMGRSSGTAAFVVRDGSMDRRAALLSGADIGRAALEHAGARTALRCLIARFVVTDGIARPAPVILDTDVGRTDGSGSVYLSDERIALSLVGHGKLGGGLRIDRPVTVSGTIKKPRVVPPPQLKSAKGIFRMVSRAIKGDTPAPVANVDCAALAARALR